MSLSEAVCRRINQLREERGLTVNGLAAICGITQSTLQNLLSGKRKTTSVSTIQKICDGLEIDLPTFFNSDLFRTKK